MRPQLLEALAATAEQPSPADRLRITQQTPDGPREDHILLWHHGDAVTCTRCRTCTYHMTRTDVGVCVVRLKVGEPFVLD